MNDTLTHTTCPICSQSEKTALQNYKEHFLVKCNSCGFVFSDIVPDSKLITSFYNTDYDRTSYFSPITAKRYEELLEQWEPYRKTGRLLDVGCGNGFFLEIAQQKGWDVYGIEVSADAVQICKDKNLSVFNGTIEEYTNEVEFDIIVSIEVIEHLSYPKSFVDKINSLLRTGGLAYITTPNFNAVLRYRLKEQYDIIDFPNHLSYFTPKTIQQLFRTSGFETKHVCTTGYSITRAKTSKGKSNQEYVSETSDDEMLRHKIEHNSALKVGVKLANGILNLFKIGDSIKGTFIKKG